MAYWTQDIEKGVNASLVKNELQQQNNRQYVYDINLFYNNSRAADCILVYAL